MELGASGKAWIPALLALVALLSTCDPARMAPAPAGLPGQGAQDIESALHGTWLREVATDDVQARRVLTLGPGHVFHESVRAVDRLGQVLEQQHEGTWFYDGTNLKRKYTSMDGKPPSRLRLPFATLQIAFEGRNEFRGVDHIGGNKVRYRRVLPGTRP